MLSELEKLDDILTTKEAAPIFVLTPRRVAGLCASRELVGAYKKGKTWLIPKKSVEIYILTHPKNKKGKNSSSVPSE